MPRHHDLTQRMTDIAQRPDTATEGEIEELAEDYAELCTDANLRLVEIRHLLGKGLRSEGVSRAQRDPDLLELVMSLDFLFLTRWNELCHQNDVPIAPLLALETAGDLNEAYTAQQPLEGLLAHHRLLALAKAPLRDRLLVLRKISDKDTLNEAWKQDIETLEKSRVRELESDVEKAGKRNDLAEIATLHREINSTRWLIPVPENVQTKVATSHRVLRRQSLIAGFEVIVSNLNIAQKNNDLPGMRKLLITAEENAVQIQPPIEAALYSQLDGPRQTIAAAASKAENQAQFDIALGKLRHALQTNISKENLVTYRTRLESKISAAEKYGLVIPEALVVQARRKLKEITSQQKRNFVLKLFAVSFTCVVLTAAVIGIVVFINISSARKAEVAKFTTLYEQGNYNQYIITYDRLVTQESEYAQNPEILKLLKEARARSAAAEVIAAKLKGLVEGLEANGFVLISSADLEEARKLAEESNDKDMMLRLDAIELSHEAFKNRSAQDKRDAYEDQYRELSLKVDRLAQNGALLTKELLDEAQLGLETLLEQYPEIADNNLIQNRLRTIVQLRGRMKTNTDFAQLKNELTVSTGNTTQYASALRNLQKFLLENPREGQMKNDIEFVLLESNFWRGAVAWGQFYGVQFQPELVIKSPIKLAAEHARAAIEKGSSLVQMYPEFETKKEFEDRIQMLLSVASRPQANLVALRAELQKIIGPTQAVLIANDAGKRTFNLPALLPWEIASAKKIGKKSIFKVFADDTYAITEEGVSDINFIYYGQAPHQIIEKDLLSVLDALNGSSKSWEEHFMDALEVLFETEKFAFPNQVKNFIGNKNLIQLHPIQRLFLARSLLSFGTDTSVILKDEFGEALNALELADVDNGIDFVGPTTDQLTLTNNNAKKALDALKVTLDKTRPVVLRQLDDFSKTPEASVIWVGWIDVRDGGYTVRFSDGKPKSGPMFTVISDGLDTSEARIIDLGSANGGILQIPQNAVGNNLKHRFGRPVFTYSTSPAKE